MSDFRELGRTIGQSVTQGRDIASLMFVWTAEKSEDNFDITTLAEHAYLFDRLVEEIPYNASQIRIDESDGQLYRCLTTHGAEHATAPPSQASALWGKIANPADEWPAWFTYTGVNDAWMIGSKCSHNGKHWISTANYNVWEPGTSGSPWAKAN